MLKITVPATELWDERTNRFITIEEQTLEMEHSLVSLSKWESKWHKPFFSKTDKTEEETIDYIKCMTLTENVPPETYGYLTKENVTAIKAYIDDPMTATTFSKDQNTKHSNRIVTSELIYCWMADNHLPVEFQHWHINRLLTLLRVCSVEHTPPKKMSAKEAIARNKAINAKNKALLQSKG